MKQPTDQEITDLLIKLIHHMIDSGIVSVRNFRPVYEERLTPPRETDIL